MKKICFLIHFFIPLTFFGQAPLSIELADSTSRGVIRGTLLLPMGTKSVPVVLFVPGSGPTDRDGNNALGVTSQCTKMMADGLAQQNIASLRFDKRGVAASAGAAKSEADLRFDDYVTDVKDWIALLRKDKRLGKLFIAGHSEGSLVGMMAAQEKGADGFISVAGAGRPIDVILNEQVAKNPNNTQTIRDEVAAILTQLRSGKTVATVPPYLASLFRASVQPYLISWIKYDPAIEIGKLTCPVLIIQGTTDLQVTLADARALKQASPKASYLEIEGMNHILKDAPADPAANMATYTKKDLPLNEKLLHGITAFVKGI